MTRMNKEVIQGKRGRLVQNSFVVAYGCFFQPRKQHRSLKGLLHLCKKTKQKTTASHLARKF